MAGTRRTRAWLRWPAGLAALVIVLAAAGSVPAQAGPADPDEALYAQCRTTAQDAAEQYRNVKNISVAVLCSRPDGTSVDPALWLPAAPKVPAPTGLITAGHTDCVTGPGRPTVGTTLTSVSAMAGPGEDIDYEYQLLDSNEFSGSSGSEVLEFTPGDLAPGGTYRWRARFMDIAEQDRYSVGYRSPDDDGQGWSPWCEFSVSANAVDYRGLGNVSPEALDELGLRPDRRYAVSLTRRQQRLLRAGTNVGRTNARMTLTGPRWTELLVQLFESAYLAEEAAAEADEDDLSPPESAAYRALVGTISVKLGGPHDPKLAH